MYPDDAENAENAFDEAPPNEAIFKRICSAKNQKQGAVCTYNYCKSFGQSLTACECSRN